MQLLFYLSEFQIHLSYRINQNCHVEKTPQSFALPFFLRNVGTIWILSDDRHLHIISLRFCCRFQYG